MRKFGRAWVNLANEGGGRGCFSSHSPKCVMYEVHRLGAGVGWLGHGFLYLDTIHIPDGVFGAMGIVDSVASHSISQRGVESLPL
jgi:hypothetical protein